MKQSSRSVCDPILVKSLSTATLAVGLLAGMSLPGSAHDLEGKANVFSPNSKPYGHSYAEWSAAQWQWAFSLPTDHHPLFDTADVSAGQSGPVWFLGGTFTTVANGNTVIGTAVRNARVPVGKALFFPIFDSESSTAEGNGATESELRSSVIDVVNHAANLTCVIDGQPVKNLSSFRFQSPLFNWGPLPANNILQNPLDFPAGLVSPAVSDGYFVMVKPLSPGRHTIHFTGAAVFTQAQDGFDFTFALDITYHLTVGPDRH